VKQVVFFAVVLGAAACLAGCTSTPGEVMDKVAYDFGLGERPEGYTAGTDRVMENLHNVGRTELKRLNYAHRHGEVEFEDEEGLYGEFYKVRKVYEDYYPQDAKQAARTGEETRQYVGYVQYSYRLFESERMSTRVEAAAAPANIETNETGRETYRYNFGAAGVWDGEEGEPMRR
jgi:hypothetical protein